jgi:hypothetical protein
MRGSILSKVVLAGLLGVAGAGALSGCKKEEAKPAESGAKPGEAADAKGATSSDGDAKGKRSRFSREALGRKLGLEPITPDEVKSMLPGLKGGTSLGEPIATARGLRVTAVECLTGDQATIKSSLEARLTELGFKAIRMSERQRMNIITVSAEKTPYRLSATVRSGPYPECPADQKKSKLLMSFFKRPARPAGAATPGSSPGDATSSPAQPPAQEKAGAPGSEKPADRADKPAGKTQVLPPPEGGSVPAPRSDPTK